ncbi:MAG TPA: hypothetical protein VGF39_01725 [Stellaceae bacterium]
MTSDCLYEEDFYAGTLARRSGSFGRLERDVSGFMSRLPRVCPYTLEQIRSSGDEGWFPSPR